MPGPVCSLSLYVAEMLWLSRIRLVRAHTQELQPHITANYCNQTLSSAFGRCAQETKSKTASAGVAQNNSAQPSMAQHSALFSFVSSHIAWSGGA